MTNPNRTPTSYARHLASRSVPVFRHVAYVATLLTAMALQPHCVTAPRYTILSLPEDSGTTKHAWVAWISPEVTFSVTIMRIPFLGGTSLVGYRIWVLHVSTKPVGVGRGDTLAMLVDGAGMTLAQDVKKDGSPFYDVERDGDTVRESDMFRMDKDQLKALIVAREVRVKLKCKVGELDFLLTSADLRSLESFCADYGP